MASFQQFGFASLSALAPPEAAASPSSDLIASSELSSMMLIRLSAMKQKGSASEDCFIFSPSPAQNDFLSFSALASFTSPFTLDHNLNLNEFDSSSMSFFNATVKLEHDLEELSFEDHVEAENSFESTTGSSCSSDGFASGGDMSEDEESFGSESSLDDEISFAMGEKEVDEEEDEMDQQFTSITNTTDNDELNEFTPIPSYSAPKGFNPSFLTSFELSGGTIPPSVFFFDASPPTTSATLKFIALKGLPTPPSPARRFA